MASHLDQGRGAGVRLLGLQASLTARDTGGRRSRRRGRQFRVAIIAVESAGDLRGWGCGREGGGRRRMGLRERGRRPAADGVAGERAAGGDGWGCGREGGGRRRRWLRPCGREGGGGASGACRGQVQWTLGCPSFMSICVHGCWTAYPDYHHIQESPVQVGPFYFKSPKPMDL
jgi:hypothetical protein